MLFLLNVFHPAPGLVHDVGQPFYEPPLEACHAYTQLDSRAQNKGLGPATGLSFESDILQHCRCAPGPKLCQVSLLPSSKSESSSIPSSRHCLPRCTSYPNSSHSAQNVLGFFCATHHVHQHQVRTMHVLLDELLLVEQQPGCMPRRRRPRCRILGGPQSWTLALTRSLATEKPYRRYCGYLFHPAFCLRCWLNRGELGMPQHSLMHDCEGTTATSC